MMGQKLSFSQWMWDVDSVLLLRLGITSALLPDVDYWSLWDGGWSAFDAAHYAAVMSVDGDGAMAGYSWFE